MKKRIISAIVMLVICVPIFIIGGNVYNIGISLIALLALKEFLDIKETKKKLPLFVKIISYAFLLIFLITGVGNPIKTFTMDFRIISGLFLAFLVPTLLYHDREKYSINDAFYMIGGMFFLALPMILFINIRAYSMNLLIYLLLITIMTDTFAYITGRLIGNHKLLEDISPKKTWEGTISGTIFGTFIGTMFYITVINGDIALVKIILVTCFLSVLGQFGDLAFSAIKRYYGKKDFSNLIPGHGGILDRIDSIIFILLGFMFFISII